ncbi:hypothetical protein ACT3TB_12625 [Micrococcaceae sp. AOP34-BR2-30]|uniref:hypothetical protein n=1 Tax=Microbacteriaceae TaxID=85023 RepID=UPI001121D004|nr:MULTISPECIES: hypothetical protein [Microbacteriaceae]MDA3146030.1 hypothetical protein [Leucobacter sp. UCMA 4100]
MAKNYTAGVGAVAVLALALAGCSDGGDAGGPEVDPAPTQSAAPWEPADSSILVLSDMSASVYDAEAGAYAVENLPLAGDGAGDELADFAPDWSWAVGFSENSERSLTVYPILDQLETDGGVEPWDVDIEPIVGDRDFEMRDVTASPSEPDTVYLQVYGSASSPEECESSIVRVNVATQKGEIVSTENGGGTQGDAPVDCRMSTKLTPAGLELLSSGHSSDYEEEALQAYGFAEVEGLNGGKQVVRASDGIRYEADEGDRFYLITDTGEEERLDMPAPTGVTSDSGLVLLPYVGYQQG